MTDLENLALEWARADRTADDRAADVERVEDAIAHASTKTAETLLADRDGAIVTFRAAVKAADEADEKLRDRCRELLDVAEAAPT